MQKLLKIIRFRTDIFVLSIFGGTFFVGIYGAAAKVVTATALLPFAITTVMYPQYSIRFKNPKQLLKKEYYKISLCMVALAVFIYPFLILFSGVTVHYVYGNKFSEAIPIINLLAIAAAIHGISMNNFTFLNAIRKEKLNVYLMSFTFIINLILDLLLIRPYGMMDIAAATVFCAITYCVTSTIMIFKINKRFTMNNLIPTGFQADMDEHS